MKIKKTNLKWPNTRQKVTQRKKVERSRKSHQRNCLSKIEGIIKKLLFNRASVTENDIKEMCNGTEPKETKLLSS
jgi:hypothetical protein